MKSSDQPPDTDTAKTNIKEATIVLHHIIRALVDFPDDVKIHPIVGKQTVVFEITVASIDIKRIIGRGGRTADSIRELLINIGAKVKSRYIIEILEPTFRVHEIPIRRSSKGQGKKTTT